MQKKTLKEHIRKAKGTKWEKYNIEILEKKIKMRLKREKNKREDKNWDEKKLN